jgi:hypothetical protein
MDGMEQRQPEILAAAAGETRLPMSHFSAAGTAAAAGCGTGAWVATAIFPSQRIEIAGKSNETTVPFHQTRRLFRGKMLFRLWTPAFLALPMKFVKFTHLLPLNDSVFHPSTER